MPGQEGVLVIATGALRPSRFAHRQRLPRVCPGKSSRFAMAGRPRVLHGCALPGVQAEPVVDCPPVEIWGAGDAGLAHPSMLWARRKPAQRVWERLQAGDAPGMGLVADPPLRMLSGLVGLEECRSLARVAMFELDRLRSKRQTAALPPQDPLVASVTQRISAAFGLDQAFVEPPRLVRYSKVGDTFEPHVDWVVDATDSQLALLGQRVATALLYLDDLPEGVGGETYFPRLGLKVRPVAGAALLWPNVDAFGKPLEATQHAALPLTAEGVCKLAVNIWIRDRPLPTDERILASLYLS